MVFGMFFSGFFVSSIIGQINSKPVNAQNAITTKEKTLASLFIICVKIAGVSAIGAVLKPTIPIKIKAISIIYASKFCTVANKSMPKMFKMVKMTTKTTPI